MGIRRFFIYSALLLAIAACGTPKKAVDDKTVNSKAEYAYLLKFHEAIRLKSKGQNQEAINAFQSALSLKKTDACYFALYELYSKENNRTQAADHLKKARELDPENLHYTIEMAYLSYEMGQVAESAALFKQLVKKQPRNPDFQYALAETLVRLGKPQEAIQALNKTEDQVGTVPELSLQKFELYLQMKKKSEAENELKKGLESNPGDPRLISALMEFYFENKQDSKAIALLEQMGAEDPENGRIQLILAEYYSKQPQPEKYFEALTRAFEGSGLELDDKTRIIIGLQEGAYKKDPRTLTLIQLLQKEYPTEAKPYTVLGDYYMATGEETKALEAYENALLYEKSAYAIWQQVMIMQYQSKQFEKLKATTTECLSYFPTIPLVYVFKAVACNQLGEAQEAISAVEVGLEYVGSDRVTKAEMYGQMGEAYFLLKDFPKGIAAYEKALQNDKNADLITNNFAYRLATQKMQLDRAESMMKEVLIKQGQQPQFIDTYGWVLFQKGQYEAALKQFELAHQYMTDDAIILEHLGDASSKLGKSEKALEYWKKALEKGAKNKKLPLKIEKKTYYDPEY